MANSATRVQGKVGKLPAGKNVARRGPGRHSKTPYTENTTYRAVPNAQYVRRSWTFRYFWWKSYVIVVGPTPRHLALKEMTSEQSAKG